ncbi:MAG: RNA polymerase factor sigma-54 [Bacteroidales bacterium]|nr:RNA polymerase factor sigma-54 [Bacteroidales bacterium]
MQRQELTLKQQQRLSPLQIQTIKLMELPVQELEQRVRTELEENPALDDTPDPDSARDEDARDVSLDELSEDDYIPSYKTRVSNWGKDPKPEYNTFSVRESFSDSLTDQLGFRNLDERKQKIGEFLIGSLDGAGYLRRSISNLVDDLAFRFGIQASEEEVEDVLHIIQGFEPAGVGARDLRECLLIQLRAKEQTPVVVNATRILEDQFEEFSNRHIGRVMARLSLSEKEMKDAMICIGKLNPKPGGQIDDSYADQAQQIVPDFILQQDGDDISFTMPRFNIPELRVNRKYAEMMEAAKNSDDRAQKEAVAFVKQKLDSAKWFIEALKQRQNTLQKTMQAILDYQHDYFVDGDESNLKPMVLKDIAAITNFDISTISRVVNSKYIETHFGIKPLKYFFSEGMENSEGDSVSTRELKKALQECVDEEDKRKPLTDEQLVVEMNKRGYKVARRTIAKYRNQLGIPHASWRKDI